MNNKLNVVFMGGFTYPKGMAATRRVQNVISALKEYPNVAARVILQRQSSKDNVLYGTYRGTPYETVMGDLFRVKMFIALPLLCHRTGAALKRAFRPDSNNVIYFYGPLFLDSVAPLRCAQKLGYKIVFDVIEDFGLTKEVSRSFYQYLRGSLTNCISSHIRELSSGIVTISSYLEENCRKLTKGKVPVHYLPISVDMASFPEKTSRTNHQISFFYAGSFGKKDGVPILLDAFDRLAQNYGNIRLVLTGRGDAQAMEEFFSRRESSPHKGRIEFKGYLDEEEYYSLLNDVDIPCMTRVNVPFANAGFPFKLGEFLATGKPVIASRVSDVDRFLVNGRNAMLVEPGSSVEICEAAEFLINNPDSAAAIGMRGREVARTFFDYKRQGKALLSFLENL